MPMSCACVAARAQQARVAELSRAIGAASAGREGGGGVQPLKGDALLDALTAAVGWTPLSLTSSAVAIGYGTPSVAFELRAALVPSAAPAPDARAIQFVELLSRGAVAGAHRWREAAT